jgi:hypothetical protein
MCNFLEYKGGFFSAAPNYYSHSPADHDMPAQTPKSSIAAMPPFSSSPVAPRLITN